MDGVCVRVCVCWWRVHTCVRDVRTSSSLCTLIGGGHYKSLPYGGWSIWAGTSKKLEQWSCNHPSRAGQIAGKSNSCSAEERKLSGHAVNHTDCTDAMSVNRGKKDRAQQTLSDTTGTWVSHKDGSQWQLYVHHSVRNYHYHTKGWGRGNCSTKCSSPQEQHCISCLNMDKHSCKMAQTHNRPMCE